MEILGRRVFGIQALPQSVCLYTSTIKPHRKRQENRELVVPIILTVFFPTPFILICQNSSGELDDEWAQILGLAREMTEVQLGWFYVVILSLGNGAVK